MLSRLTNWINRRCATSRRRLIVVGAGVAMALLAALWFAARTGAVDAPAVVDYEAKTVIRADSPGFLRELHVQSGHRVELGQLLATLDNPQLRSELLDVELALQRSLHKSIGYRNRLEMAASQAELCEIESLQKRLAEKRAQLALLTIRAPSAGTVVSRRLDWKLGAYFSAGAEILTIGHEHRKEVVGSVAQDDVKAFNAAVGSRVKIEVSGMPPIEATLARVSPTASSSSQHASLYAINGGPLPVRRLDQADAAAATSQSQVELLAPRFTAFVELSGRQGLQLRAGQRARIRLP
jgi:putative peptide zinc metalloprotease protein